MDNNYLTVDTNALKEFKKKCPDLYEPALLGVQSYLGIKNVASCEYSLPGGIPHVSPNMPMIEFLKKHGILTKTS